MLHFVMKPRRLRNSDIQPSGYGREQATSCLIRLLLITYTLSLARLAAVYTNYRHIHFWQEHGTCQLSRLSRVESIKEKGLTETPISP